MRRQIRDVRPMLALYMWNMRPLLQVLAFLGFASCVLTPVLTSARPDNEAQLVAAVESFYRAESPDALRSAVEQAQAAGPTTALFHELAARWAQFEGRDADVVQHLQASLLDSSGDAALLNLHWLASLELTWAERAQVRALFQSMMERHPSPDVRALAAFHLAQLLGAEGDFSGRDETLAAIPGQIDLAWAGTWDNDQGKGFDLDLPPQSRPALSETYEGRASPIGWRTNLPKDGRARYDLLQLMTPARWAAAFGQGRFSVPHEGKWALRVTSSDPLKVWIDGRLVFSEAQIDRSALDHLVIPLHLPQGNHTLLVKSAHREGAWHFAARITPLEGTLKSELSSL